MPGAKHWPISVLSIALIWHRCCARGLFWCKAIVDVGCLESRHETGCKKDGAVSFQ